MATFNERIQVVIDVVSSKATTGLKDFKSAIADAQGFTGKLKAGVGALKDQFAAAAASPAAMAAAVTAAGTYAIQAAEKFSQLGVEVGKFSDATGLAAEDASRYIEVAGDIGVSSDTLTSVFNKLNKSIDPKLFDQLGISIARTAEGNVNVSETFLNVVDQLNQIQDPARKAEVASKLLGKGWTEAAELVGMSAHDLRKQLAAVGDEKVFNDKEVKQARDYRAAMDNLNDAFEKVTITVGQKMAPSIATAVDGLAMLADKLDIVLDKADWLGLDAGNNIAAGFDELAGGEGSFVQRATAAFQDFADAIPIVGGKLQDLLPDVEIVAKEYSGLTEETVGLGDAATQSARYLGLLAQHTRESADAGLDLDSAARLARASLKLLQDQIDGRKSFIDLQIQLRDNADKIKELESDFASGKTSAEDYYLGVASAALDSQGAVADYVSTVDSIPETQRLELVATLDPASPQSIINTIQGSLDSHVFQVRAETAREDRRTGGGGGVGNVTINVTAPVGASQVEIGRGVHDALQSYYRNGGEP